MNLTELFINRYKYWGDLRQNVEDGTMLPNMPQRTKQFEKNQLQLVINLNMRHTNS